MGFAVRTGTGVPCPYTAGALARFSAKVPGLVRLQNQQEIFRDKRKRAADFSAALCVYKILLFDGRSMLRHYNRIRSARIRPALRAKLSGQE